MGDFDENTIANVIPSFGHLIRQEYAQGLPKDFYAKAVGFRRRPREARDGKYFPHNIGDSWSDFDSAFRAISGGESRFLDYVVKAKSLLHRTGECQELYSLVLDGPVHLSQAMGLVDRDGNRISKNSLLHTVRDSPKEMRRRFDGMMRDLCMDEIPLRSETWSGLTRTTIEVLATLFPYKSPAGADDFVQWDDRFAVSSETAQANSPNRRNVYRYQSGEFRCDIEVTTIHRVKGQTHDATPVLETYFNKVHDIKKAIQYLTAEGNDCVGADTNTKEHLKRLYVAMTRPRELLCLAIHKDHLGGSDTARNDVLNRLRQKGWQILDLTRRGESQG